MISGMTSGRSRVNFLLALPLIAASGCMGFGKAGASLETDIPELEVTLSLDKTSYGIGETVEAEITVTNRSESRVSISRLSSKTTNFYVRPITSPHAIDVRAVTCSLEDAEWLDLEPGKADRRRFVIPLATAAPGEFQFFVVYRSEPDPEIASAATVPSPPVPLEVNGPIVMERDTLGLIVEREAKRVAKKFFGRQSERVDAKKILDDNLKYYLWWVTVNYSLPDENGNMSGSCFIDPFRGVVARLTEKAVDTAPNSDNPLGPN